MTTLTDRPRTALLVVDVQNDVVAQAHDRDGVVGRIAGLVDRARAAHVPVVWVQHADGGLMTTKPYAAGGAYINRMSDYCKPCAYDPKVRIGPKACPFTAGYWAFLDRNQQRLAGNFRMTQALRGLDRLKDRDAVVAQESERGDAPP